jgi:hypothetical protein
LRRHGVDHAAAFQQYDNTLRPLCRGDSGEGGELWVALMFPRDDAEIAERNRKLSEGSMDL